MGKKQEIYDRISKALTDYEDVTSRNIVEPWEYQNVMDEFYNILVQVQNRWEDVITSSDE